MEFKVGREKAELRKIVSEMTARKVEQRKKIALLFTESDFSVTDS